MTWALTRAPTAIELVGPHGYIHGWVKVGIAVEHKDGSRGVVRKYDPATQTAHVDFHSGPRRDKPGKQTTKAYHLHSIEGELAEGLRKQAETDHRSGKIGATKTAEKAPKTPAGGSGRKHNYGVGDQITHKDGSVGTVTGYASATQTVHVAWQSGPRSRVKGGAGTTKGYHVTKAEGGFKSVNPAGAHSGAGRVVTHKPAGRPKTPDDPFAGIPGAGPSPETNKPIPGLSGPMAQQLRDLAAGKPGRTQPSTLQALESKGLIEKTDDLTGGRRITAKGRALVVPAVDLPAGSKPLRVDGKLKQKQAEQVQYDRDVFARSGLEPITGTENRYTLADKLQSHYEMAARYPYSDKSAAIAQHHRDAGIPAFVPRSEGTPLQHATMASHIAVLHRGKTDTPPRLMVRDLSKLSGSNAQTAQGTVAMQYSPMSETIESSPQHLTDTGSGRYTLRGQFSRSGTATFTRRSLTHEYGHHLDDQLSPKEQTGLRRGALTRLGVDPAYLGVGDTMSDSQWNATVRGLEAKIINQVSTYGSASHHELIAELYTEGKLAADPSEAAKYVQRYLDRVGEEKR